MNIIERNFSVFQRGAKHNENFKRYQYAFFFGLKETMERTILLNLTRKYLNEKKYVWMLKLGKRTSTEKLRDILDEGGWLILRAPKSEGSKSFIARYVAFSEK